MISVVSAFAGCFAALLVLAEVQAQSKVVRYLAAFVVGILVAVLLGLLVQWIASTFARV